MLFYLPSITVYPLYTCFSLLLSCLDLSFFLFFTAFFFHPKPCSPPLLAIKTSPPIYTFTFPYDFLFIALFAVNNIHVIYLIWVPLYHRNNRIGYIIRILYFYRAILTNCKYKGLALNWIAFSSDADRVVGSVVCSTTPTTLGLPLWKCASQREKVPDHANLTKKIFQR